MVVARTALKGGVEDGKHSVSCLSSGGVCTTQKYRTVSTLTRTSRTVSAPTRAAQVVLGGASLQTAATRSVCGGGGGACSRSNKALVCHGLAKHFDSKDILQDLLSLAVEVGVHERLRSFGQEKDKDQRAAATSEGFRPWDTRTGWVGMGVEEHG
jgi:hypothetical protein